MKIIGHRGAKGLAPENTIVGFMKAIEYGVDEIECDVRVTKDGIPVVIHNARLADASGNLMKINKHSYIELKAHKSDLATLDDTIKAVTRNTRLQIEIKSNQPLKPIIKILKSRLSNGWQPEDFLVSSKQFSLLKNFHDALPQVPIAVIESWSALRATYRARELNTKYLSMNQLWLWRGVIVYLSRHNYLLNAYPLNDVRRAKKWASYGLYGVITDYPDKFIK